MKFWDKITGSDMTREMAAFETRAAGLPTEYQAAWEQMKAELWPYAGLTGRKGLPLLDSALNLLEETASEGKRCSEVLGGDIKAFCRALAGGAGAASVSDRQRAKLNKKIAKKLCK